MAMLQQIDLDRNDQVTLREFIDCIVKSTSLSEQPRGCHLLRTWMHMRSLLGLYAGAGEG
jgi:hypothetical protein